MSNVVTRYDECQICMQRCALAVEVDTDLNKIVRIMPDKKSANWRDFCSMAAHADRLLSHPKRILKPMKRVGDHYVEASYEEAIEDIARRLQQILDADGPNALGLYVGGPGASPSCSTHAYALYDTFGSKNRYMSVSTDTNSIYTVNKAMFGSYWNILVGDIDNCDCFLLLGTNPAVSAMNWTDVNIDGWGRILKRVKQGADLIVVDPRITESASKAKLHVAIKPGQDWAFLLGLIKHVFENGWEHQKDCDAANGVEQIRSIAQAASYESLAEQCEVPVATMQDVARRFATARRAQLHTRTGLSMTRNGTIGEWLGWVLNIVTGRIDRPGGRYHQAGVVDGVAMAEMYYAPDNAVSRVRGLPKVIGCHAISEMADEIETPGPGRMRGLFIIGGNAVNTGPDGDALDRALGKLDLLISVDLLQRETHRHAHWLIPSTHFLEREEFVMLFAAWRDNQTLRYKSASIRKPDSIWHTHEFFIALAKRMNLPLFGQPAGAVSMEDTFKGSLAGTGIDWETLKASPHGLAFNAPKAGHFMAALRTPDQRINAAPAAFVERLGELLIAETPQASDYPFTLISRRRRDTNSSMAEAIAKPKPLLGAIVEMNHEDGVALGVRDLDRIRIKSRTGELDAVARLTTTLRPGVACMEQGFGSRVFDPTGAHQEEVIGANRNRLVSNKDLDTLSAMPRFNDTAVRIERLAAGGSAPAEH